MVATFCKEGPMGKKEGEGEKREEPVGALSRWTSRPETTEHWLGRRVSPVSRVGSGAVHGWAPLSSPQNTELTELTANVTSCYFLLYSSAAIRDAVLPLPPTLGTFQCTASGHFQQIGDSKVDGWRLGIKNKTKQQKTMGSTDNTFCSLTFQHGDLPPGRFSAALRGACKIATSMTK